MSEKNPTGLSAGILDTIGGAIALNEKKTIS
jgi:hypothetical protein